MKSYPTIMIGIPVKNSARFLKQMWKTLTNIDYPKNKIRVVFEYGESRDNTMELLKSFKKQNIFRVEVYEEPFDVLLRGMGPHMAACLMNDFKDLLEEDYFLLFDSDILEVPKNLLKELLKVDADIVAPYTWSEKHRHFYDNFMFRINNTRFSPEDPPGTGLKYPIEVDSVGTCFLVRHEVFKDVEIKNPYPHLLFCGNAKNLGYNIVACPYLEIIHVDWEKLGVFHKTLDPRYGGLPNPGFITSKYKVKIYRREK